MAMVVGDLSRKQIAVLAAALQMYVERFPNTAAEVREIARQFKIENVAHAAAKAKREADRNQGVLPL